MPPRKKDKTKGIHALAGYGGHDKEATIQDFFCQRCTNDVLGGGLRCWTVMKRLSYPLP